MVKKMHHKVIVAGLGIIGRAVARYLIDKGYIVYGYDVKKLNITRFPISNIWEELPHHEIDVYIITVYAGLKNGTADMSSVEDVVHKIATVNNDALVIIESTVIPGCCRMLSEKYKIGIAHCPHRYWAGDPVHYGVKQIRVLGATDEKTLDQAIEFYQSLDIPIHVVSNVEVAELAKIVENAYRYLNITFSELIRMLCERMNINFWELRQAVNTKWNVKLPEARKGIGGSCLPKDTNYLLNLHYIHEVNQLELCGYTYHHILHNLRALQLYR